MKKLKDNKMLRFILKAIEAVVTIMIVLFVLVVFLQRFSDNKISFFKYRMFTVVSPSMEPKYVIGDVLIAKEVDPSTIKVGDAVCYLGDKREVVGKVITHEVIDIEKSADGKYSFHTKGILQGAVEDPIVDEDQLYGVIQYKVKTLSYIYKLVGTTEGLFMFVIIPILYIVGSEMLLFMLDREDTRRSKAKAIEEQEEVVEEKKTKKKTSKK